MNHFMIAGPKLVFGLLAITNLPTFDWQAALFVGAIVVVAVVAVTVIAIATPFVAIQAGATLIGTAVTIGAIALTTGVIGGVAAGFYEGGQADTDYKRRIVQIAGQSNQMQIRFLPSASDAASATDFQCEVVTYNEADLTSRPPRVEQEEFRITAASGSEFFSILKNKIEIWFAQNVLADQDGEPRRVTIFMEPYPGDGVYERIVELISQCDNRTSEVQRVNGPWRSAISNQQVAK